MAISQLFLDSDLDESTFARLRNELRASRLPLRDLDEIYYDELAPILYRNLRVPAGVWSGFDAEWLEEQIRRRGSPSHFQLLARLRRYAVTRSTIKDWRRLRQMLE
jgi:hypothetical protein